MTWQPIFWRGKERGRYLDHRNAYVSPRTPEMFCRKYQGWGIQKEILDKLVKRGCHYVIILYTPAKGAPRVAHRVHISAYLERGIEDTLREEDGLQVFLHESEFQQIPEDPGQRRLKVPMWTPANQPPGSSTTAPEG